MADSATIGEEVQRREQVRRQVREGAALTPTYLFMNWLATIIACYGLLTDSVSGVIGAMVIAMLLGPISAVGLALVEGDGKLLRSALLSELAGVAVVMGTAFLIGLLHRDIPLGNELKARTHPGSGDLMIALAGGVAATVAAVARGVNLSLVGVAIATALVPPLSTCSILLARGGGEPAFEAFLLAFANMVAIQFASSVVFWIAGYGKAGAPGAAGTAVMKRNLVTIVLLIGLAGLFGIGTYRSLRSVLYQTAVRKTLSSSLESYPGATLEQVRFDPPEGQSLVRAVIHSPRPFAPREILGMEEKLPYAPSGERPRLRILRVAVELMTDQGPVTESDEGSVPPAAPERK
jgi:uncharacterized hydrophobic protein (TIGR00271 family)